MARVHNFSAGPAVLPLPVLEEARDALIEFEGSGLGAMEYSHRSKRFEAVLARAKERLSRLLGLSADQRVLFLHGGAKTQFFQIPMNLLRGGRAAYLDTGVWAKNAIDEAKRYGTVDVPFSSQEGGWRRVPRPGEWGALDPSTKYLHYTSNNTVAGTQFSYTPDPGSAWLVCDASSDVLSRRVDGSKWDLMYAGAQKNLGPSGLCVVVIRDTLVEACDPNIPSMLQYGVAVKNDSLYNTPNTWAIYLVERVCAWIEAQGGIDVVQANNERRAAAIYAAIDASSFFRGRAETGSRSVMNVTFTTGTDELDLKFAKDCEANGLVGLKGHKSLGGIRASCYNAQTDEAVDALVGAMREFERTHG
jgi:phosphoserine aminotransferase